MSTPTIEEIESQAKQHWDRVYKDKPEEVKLKATPLNVYRLNYFKKYNVELPADLKAWNEIYREQKQAEKAEYNKRYTHKKDGTPRKERWDSKRRQTGATNLYKPHFITTQMQSDGYVLASQTFTTLDQAAQWFARVAYNAPNTQVHFSLEYIKGK